MTARIGNLENRQAELERENQSLKEKMEARVANAGKDNQLQVSKFGHDLNGMAKDISLDNRVPAEFFELCEGATRLDGDS